MKRWMQAVLVVAAVGLLTGCSSGPKTVEIQVQDMAFKTKKIQVKKGVPVKLVLNNRDKETHDLSIDEIPVEVTAQTPNPDGHSHADKEPDLHLGALPGEKGWVEFTPKEAGTYTFYCHVDGHRDKGMEGTLVVS